MKDKALTKTWWSRSRFTGLVAGLVLFNGATQAQDVLARFGDFADAEDVLSVATLHSNGNLVMVGTSNELSRPFLPALSSLVVETDPSGAAQNGRFFAYCNGNPNQPWPTETYGVAESGGYFYVTGKVTDPQNGAEDIFVAKLDPNAGTIAMQRIDIGNSFTEHGVRVMVQGSDVYVIGVTNFTGSTFQYQSASYPLMETVVLRLDNNLIGLTIAERIVFPGLTVSAEARDFTFNPSGPLNSPELAVIGHLRGADVQVIDPDLPGGSSHTSSFMMRFDLNSRTINNFLVYCSFLGGASFNTESLKLESIHYESGGSGPKYIVSGQVETALSSLSGGYFFYGGAMSTSGLIIWERLFSYRNVQAMINSNYVGVDSHGYDLRGYTDPNNSQVVNYYGIGTAYNPNGNTDIFYIYFSYDYQTHTQTPVSSHVYDGGQHEEGRSVFMHSGSAGYTNIFMGAGFSKSLTQSSGNNYDFVFQGSPNFFSGCDIETAELNNAAVLTSMYVPPTCNSGLPGRICNYLANFRLSVIQFMDASPDKEIVCPGQRSATAEGGVDLNVFPIPATNSLQVEGLVQNHQYTIFSITGMLLQSGTVTPGNSILDVSELAAGTYILVLSNNAGIQDRLRFLKQ